MIVGDGTAAFVFTEREQGAALYPVVRPMFPSSRGWGAVRGAKDSGVTEKAEQFRLFRARSTTSTRTAIRALYAGWEGGVVYVGFDGVFEYVSGGGGEFDELPDLE